MSQLKIVIRAGGTGTRLWPLSTADLPKQFVPVLSEKTLLQETFERVRIFGIENIFVTTNARYVDIVREQVPELLEAHIIAEPLKRNTGPGVAFETATLAKFFEGQESEIIIASIPSDDFVGNADAFVTALKEISRFVSASPESIVMPLVTPAAVDPGYSYVRADFENQSNGEGLAAITEWVEKPDPELCRAMIAAGNWFAHTGMYIWKLDTAVRMFETFAPAVWSQVLKIRDELLEGDREGALAAAHELPIISIESLVTKLYPKKVGYRADSWGWSDVGKWTVVKDLLHADDKKNASTHDKVHFVNAQNNLVYGAIGKRVVCVGVSDLIIVDRGDQLLICRVDESPNIGAISEELGKL
ncbi:MAG: sugar phosphate nucleotidyltransferase [Candidatus Magasanikbacteria bacterium]|nr:sugar phosphate nucleotidyltransferase [Candidatus Magasanikbacteria bacterium]